MDRLTFDGNFCDIAQCRELPCPHGGSCTQRKVWEKLKAYEDLGLDPEEYKRALSADIMVRVAAVALGVPAEALRDMVELDKAGRLVVLPCKPGDLLWTFCSYPVEQVYSFIATDIRTTNGRTMMSTSRCGVIDACAVGKTVFLTREEAEKALEAVRDE
jgi:hypothetical protein